MLTESKSRVDNNLLALLNRNPNAVVNFAAESAEKCSGFLELDGDEIGKNLWMRSSKLRAQCDVAGAIRYFPSRRKP